VSLAGKRVLVVEDESLIAMLVEGYLEELGCVVAGSAARLPDALAMAGVVEADLAVLDINLDGQLSYPVAERLRARGVRVVFATGYGVAGLPAALRGSPVLPKPFSLEQLDAALRAAGAG
jgi:CheY-like chemotaxis protein